jgi:hypothetical protein
MTLAEEVKELLEEDEYEKYRKSHIHLIQHNWKNSLDHPTEYVHKNHLGHLIKITGNVITHWRRGDKVSVLNHKELPSYMLSNPFKG